MSETETIQASLDGPVTLSSLLRDLRALGLEEGMTVLVHSSLRALGWVCGGPVAVVQALEALLGPAGTLVMPTHSGELSDPAQWRNPPVPETWWEAIRQEMPAYEPDLTPTRQMGAIVECFRHQRGVLRSTHPQHSFAAWGAQATQVVRDHDLRSSLGEGSPLARLYELDGWVLLLGVGHGNNTSLHLAEYRAEQPAKYHVKCAAPLLVDGCRRWVEYDSLLLDDEDFPLIGEAFDGVGQVRQGKVGQAQARLFRQRPLVDFGVAWMNEHRPRSEEVQEAHV